MPSLARKRDNAAQSVERRMAAIMFTDLAGYSAMVRDNEALALMLLDLHFEMVRARLPGYGGREIKTIGDAFMIEFPSALQAVHCALSIQQAQARYNEANVSGEQFHIRIGIHMGDVEPRGNDLFGDGVNIAARIEPHSPRGGLAVSASVHDAVRGRISAPFSSQGAKALKNVSEGFEIFQLDQEAISAAEPEPDPAPLPKRRHPARRPKNQLRAVVIAALIIASAATLFMLGQRADNPPALAAAAPLPLNERAMAVLPLTSLSIDPQDQFFADGLHDTLLTELARIKDIRVISRTSVLRFRDTEMDLRDIGQELGTRYLVEGTVQHAGDHLRVNAQLIDAKENMHVWAEVYDRKVEDVFALQADMARSIAGSVKSELTAEEVAEIGSGGSSNVMALEAYLRAKADSGSVHIPIIQDALRNAQYAIALDPDFAQAQALVSTLLIRLIHRGADTSAQAREAARQAAAAAQRLAPDLGESQFAAARVLEVLDGDRQGAFEQMKQAAQSSPGDTGILLELAFMQGRLNHFRAAVNSIDKLALIDPLNDYVAFRQAEMHYMVGDYPGSFAAVERLKSGFPEHQVRTALYEAIIRFAGSGGDRQSVAAYLRSPTPPGDKGCLMGTARYALAIAVENYADALASVEICPGDSVGAPGGGRVPKSYYQGETALLRGEPKTARRLLEQARVSLQTFIAQQPGNAHGHAYLSLVLSYLGDHSAAVAVAKKARQLMPFDSDAIQAPYVLNLTALSLAHAGKIAEALDELELSLSVPYGWQVPFARQDPRWKPLHSEPRFQQLLDNASSKPI